MEKSGDRLPTLSKTLHPSWSLTDALHTMVLRPYDNVSISNTSLQYVRILLLHPQLDSSSPFPHPHIKLRSPNSTLPQDSNNNGLPGRLDARGLPWPSLDKHERLQDPHLVQEPHADQNWYPAEEKEGSQLNNKPPEALKKHKMWEDPLIILISRKFHAARASVLGTRTRLAIIHPHINISWRETCPDRIAILLTANVIWVPWQTITFIFGVHPGRSLRLVSIFSKIVKTTERIVHKVVKERLIIWCANRIVRAKFCPRLFVHWKTRCTWLEKI